MKRILMTACVVFLCMLFLVPCAGATSDKQENSAAQDMLVKNEVETAVSMLQAIFA